jgi:hypothetical protein
MACYNNNNNNNNTLNTAIINKASKAMAKQIKQTINYTIMSR